MSPNETVDLTLQLIAETNPRDVTPINECAGMSLGPRAFIACLLLSRLPDSKRIEISVRHGQIERQMDKSAVEL